MGSIFAKGVGMKKYRIKKRQVPTNNLLKVYDVLSEVTGTYRLKQFNKIYKRRQRIEELRRISEERWKTD